MPPFLWICVGGAAGTGARYLVSGWMHAWLGIAFPYGTLAVNVLGSFLLGALMQLGQTTATLSPTLLQALTIGAMGGFTTYSTFSYETVRQLQQADWALALANIGLTVVTCLGACFFGIAAARAVAGG